MIKEEVKRIGSRRKMEADGFFVFVFAAAYLAQVRGAQAVQVHPITTWRWVATWWESIKKGGQNG